MSKLVLSVELYDNYSKSNAVENVKRIAGVESVSVDYAGRRMMVWGDMDALDVVNMMRNVCATEIVTLTPPKEEKKHKKDKGKKSKNKIQQTQYDNDSDEFTEGCRSCDYQKQQLARAHRSSYEDDSDESCGNQTSQPRYYSTNSTKARKNPKSCVIC